MRIYILFEHEWADKGSCRGEENSAICRHLALPRQLLPRWIGNKIFVVLLCWKCWLAIENILLNIPIHCLTKLKYTIMNHQELPRRINLRICVYAGAYDPLCSRNHSPVAFGIGAWFWERWHVQLIKRWSPPADFCIFQKCVCKILRVTSCLARACGLRAKF